MTKHTVALLALGLTLLGAVFGFGIRIGALTEQVQAQNRQLELLNSDVRVLTTELKALNLDFAGTRGEIMRLIDREDARRRVP